MAREGAAGGRPDDRRARMGRARGGGGGGGRRCGGARRRVFRQGWAYGELAQGGRAQLMQRSLEAYQRAGNLVRQAGVLMSLGVVCQWEGRWDEALSYYERGRDESVKDRRHRRRGACAHQRRRDSDRSRRMGRGRGDAAGNAAVVESIAVSLLACRLPVAARPRVAAARTPRRSARAARRGEGELPPCRCGEGSSRRRRADRRVPRRDGQRRTLRSRLVQRLARPRERVERGRERRAAAGARAGPRADQQGDLWGARDALEASLAAARERNDLFEATLTMLSLIELDRLEGVEPPHRDGDGEPRHAREPEDPRGTAGAATGS